MEKFPHLNKNETKIITSFAHDNEQTAAVLQLVYRLFAKFITSKNKRSRNLYRLKLFDIAGLICLIPASELYAAIPVVEVPFDSNISESMSDYAKGEFSPQAVLASTVFKGLANLQVDGNETFKSLLLKTDKNGIPCIRSIMFLPDLSELAKDISATSESFTRTILIASSQDGVKRDKVSVMYDLVQQADFLFHVQNESDVIIKEIARVRMNVRACIFALEVFDFIYYAAIESRLIEYKDGILSASEDDGHEIILYLEFIKNSLIDPLPERIEEECNVDSVLASKVLDSIKSVKDFQAYKVMETAESKTDA